MQVSKNAWLYVDRPYGKSDRLLDNLCELEQWWDAFCRESNWLARGILTAGDRRASDTQSGSIDMFGDASNLSEESVDLICPSASVGTCKENVLHFKMLALK